MKVLTALFFLVSIGMFNNGIKAQSLSEDNPNSSFEFTISNKSHELVVEGQPEFVFATSSSNSINMKKDSSVCVIHFFNMKNSLEERVYNIEENDYGRSAIVCAIEGFEKKERIASERGVITISNLENQNISGSFDIELIGGKTGINYSAKGNFELNKGNEESFFDDPFGKN